MNRQHDEPTAHTSEGENAEEELAKLRFENQHLANALAWEERFREYRDHLEKTVRRGLMGVGLVGVVGLIVGLMSIYDQLTSIVQEQMEKELGTAAMTDLMDRGVRRETARYLRAMELDGRLENTLRSSNPQELRCAINVLARSNFASVCVAEGGVLTQINTCEYNFRRPTPLILPFPDLDC